MAGTIGVQAGDIKGVVFDKELNEPLMGASVRILGTHLGTTADLNGQFKLQGLKKGTYTIEVSYVSFFPQKMTLEVPAKGEVVVTVNMLQDDNMLDEVTVTARKNLELELALLAERQNAVLSIENLGASEMSVKGISNVQEGVKKLTGISIAEAGQLIVRGLGDRYSTTTLNGLPIASPNPDNKLIPLDIFPSSAVQNITVSKVYEAGTFADYSGAHVDISTKEGGTKDFFNVSFGTGGKVGTLFGDFYQMDRANTMFRAPSMDQTALDIPYAQFADYSRNHDIFPTTFEVGRSTAIPDLNGSFGFGRTFDVGSNQMDVLATFGIDTDNKKIDGAYVRTFEASGNEMSRFDYDSYTKTLQMAGLLNIGYQFRKSDRIGLSAFYARNAVDSYMLRDGYDEEDNVLTGSNQNSHIYMLQNYQLSGHHEMGKWDVNWNGSYSLTSSDEPDRRQVMFVQKSDGTMGLFNLNAQGTMRYYGALDEDEWVADMNTQYRFGEANKVRFGVAMKDKSRDFTSTKFYYNVDNLDMAVDDPMHTDGYLNYANVQNGTIEITRNSQKRDGYTAGSRILAGFVEADYYPVESFLINLGLRVENSRQWVDYFDDGGQPYRRNLDTDDLFPALNMKYTLNKKNSLRLSASRTVTRPSFVEMAPFLYQESYGGTQVRGNADLQNGYNYNVDLRYEFFRPSSADMVAVTAYYKYLESPIERTQTTAGGAMMHSFQNASDGLAAGVELEARKEVIKSLRVGVNASFMYTNVELPEGGVYTNSERPLQGASPYLVNADLTYAPQFGEGKQLSLALLYNLQGERIQAVGIQGIGDVKQQALHTLDFNANMRFNTHWSVKFQVKNLLNSDVIFRQEIPQRGITEEVERFKEGVGVSLGVTYAL
ncbi:MAG TPA: TonB-dependent receptor [Candidatus Paraprevotella stercorigallinarum]|nr:TonB-dependent receptor [Candidatus Paraprevotella stercorigallinarum]